MTTRKNAIILTAIALAASACAKGRHFRLARVPIPQDTLCIKADRAHLVFPGNHDAFDLFYKKLAKLLVRGTNRINILHMGGSHVQAGYLTDRIRNNLTRMHDSTNVFRAKAADRGTVFPFRAINTNAPTNYTISHTGQWRASKCISATQDAILGLCGIAAVTNDETASLTFRLHDDTYSFSRIRVLGYSPQSSSFPVIAMGTDTIFPAVSDNGSGYLFHLPSPTTQCTVSFCNVSDSSTFVVRGLMPESNRPGITYSESGINGASVPAWLNCAALEKEMELLCPDLIIFGIGINDAATTYDNFDPETFKDNYRKLIGRTRKVSPKAALLFITNNDCCQSMRIRKPNLNTARVEQAFMELAEEYNGAVFDLYRVMGGQNSSAVWAQQQLMREDRVHFTESGYQTVGDLIYNALAEDFENSTSR